MEKGKKKYLLNIVLVLALVCGISYFMIRDQINEVLEIINTMVTRDLVALFGILGINILVCSLLVTTLGRIYNKHYSIKDGVYAHLISNMFFSITPMGIGLYPSSVYLYKKQKMNTEESVSMVMIQTLLKQIFVVFAFVIRSVLSLVIAPLICYTRFVPIGEPQHANLSSDFYQLSNRSTHNNRTNAERLCRCPSRCNKLAPRQD